MTNFFIFWARLYQETAYFLKHVQMKHHVWTSIPFAIFKPQFCVRLSITMNCRPSAQAVFWQLQSPYLSESLQCSLINSSTCMYIWLHINYVRGLNSYLYVIMYFYISCMYKNVVWPDNTTNGLSIHKEYMYIECIATRDYDIFSGQFTNSRKLLQYL